MILKYGLNIDYNIIINRITNLINQVYKLLPVREECSDWQKPLETILEELIGMDRLMNLSNQELFFPLISKLEGLYGLTQEKDFQCYRRTIFECLSLMNELKVEICPQKLQKKD